MIYDSRMICQVRTDCLITYAQNCYGFQLSPLQKQAMRARMAAAAKTKYSGLFTAGAQKRIGRAIDLMIQIAKPVYGVNEVTKKRQKHVLSFITLTMPEIHKMTAKIGYDKLLKHFLQWLRRTQKVRTYVWKAEFTVKGTLHYHITTPAWIHYQEIKDKWNNLLRSSGLLDEYFKSKGHYGANSTDVHEVKHVGNLAGYLKKEFCKAIQNQQSDGKLWDCSANLKDNKYFQLELDYNLLMKIQRDVASGKLEVIELEQCKIYKATDKTRVQEPLSLKQIQEYKSYIKFIQTYQRCATETKAAKN